ncbi:MAG: GTP 3',8-cyclase MoaA [Bacillota bacterium]
MNADRPILIGPAVKGVVEMSLIDAYGRKHDYLRVSVTDRCNLRCIYCMSEEGIEQISHNEILCYEDMLKVIRTGTEMGITKIRVTGGEPLVRLGIVDFIREIAALPGVSDLAMTTNGILLPRYAAGLKTAGLKRINISLDSLKPLVYNSITRCGKLEDVLAGISAALENDLQPVKINVVLMKGINDGEVEDFLQLAREKPLHIRFIEYMPIGDHDHSYGNHYLPLSFVEETAKKAGLPLTPVPTYRGPGPADYYTLPGGKGMIGLIHAISKHFCSTCNRLRLTSEGNLKACLYWQEEKSVRPVIDNPDALKALFRKVLANKPAEHQMASDGRCGAVQPGTMRSMSKTGG